VSARPFVVKRDPQCQHPLCTAHAPVHPAAPLPCELASARARSVDRGAASAAHAFVNESALVARAGKTSHGPPARPIRTTHAARRPRRDREGDDRPITLAFCAARPFMRSCGADLRDGVKPRTAVINLVGLEGLPPSLRHRNSPTGTRRLPGTYMPTPPHGPSMTTAGCLHPPRRGGFEVAAESCPIAESGGGADRSRRLPRVPQHVLQLNRSSISAIGQAPEAPAQMCRFPFAPNHPAALRDPSFQVSQLLRGASPGRSLTRPFNVRPAWIRQGHPTCSSLTGAPVSPKRLGRQDFHRRRCKFLR